MGHRKTKKKKNRDSSEEINRPDVGCGGMRVGYCIGRYRIKLHSGALGTKGSFLAPPGCRLCLLASMYGIIVNHMIYIDRILDLVKADFFWRLNWARWPFFVAMTCQTILWQPVITSLALAGRPSLVTMYAFSRHLLLHRRRPWWNQDNTHLTRC